MLNIASSQGCSQVAVQAAARKMSERGSGSILLTGGGYALEPNPDYISPSIGKAGIRALAHGLFETLKSEGVHLATVTVAALVSPGSDDAEAVAEHFWELHNQPQGKWVPELKYAP